MSESIETETRLVVARDGGMGKLGLTSNENSFRGGGIMEML